MHWQVRWSRRLNALTGGRPSEMLCSRLYRYKRTRLTFIVNVIFLPIDWRWGHVRRAYHYERRLREETRSERLAEAPPVQAPVHQTQTSTARKGAAL